MKSASSEFLFLNGILLRTEEANIPIDDRGFLLGDGLFETIRFDRNNAPAFPQHWARLKKGCNILGISLSLSSETTYQQIKTLLHKNHLENKIARVRITLTRGEGSHGLVPPKMTVPTILIRCFEILPKKSAPISVMHSTITINERSPLRQFKSLNYADNIIARQQALAAGYDDAFLYNTQGFLVGATSANVFLIIDDKIVTPALASGALPGIMRQQLIESAKQQGAPIHETLLRQEDCARAQAAFITNSIIRQTPISRIENQTLKSPSELYNPLIYK